MSAQIIRFTGNTVADIEPTEVLTGAIEANLKSVVVVGREPNGDLYLAGSTADVAQIGLLFEIAKLRLWKELEGQ